MPKAHRKGKAFDKPGPDSKYLAGRRAAAAAFSARMAAARYPQEKEILAMVDQCPQLALSTRQHFKECVRSALRRVKDSPTSTPCDNYSKKGGQCLKCKCVRAPCLLNVVSVCALLPMRD